MFITGFKYGSRNVLADEGIREGIKKFTSWPTIPQVTPAAVLTPLPACVPPLFCLKYKAWRG